MFIEQLGYVFGDISVEASYPHYSLAAENTPPNCSCSLNAMVICQQCGVFCHDECMGSSKLCISCVIRWAQQKHQFSH